VVTLADIQLKYHETPVGEADNERAEEGLGLPLADVS
jgi:hypothetical protein